MNPSVVQLLATLEMSLTLSVLTIAVFFTFRIMRFPDLTAEGAFGFCAMGAAWCGHTTGSAWAALALGAFLGAICCALTAVLASGFKLPTIFSGILTSTMVFATGLILFRQPNMDTSGLLAPGAGYAADRDLFGRGMALSLVALTTILLLLTLLFHSGIGLLLRARSDNPLLFQSFNRSPLRWDIGGLVLSGALIGLTATLFSQRAGYASLTMGTGMAINALAAVMTAEALFPSRSLAAALGGCILATFLLQLVRSVGLSLGLPDGSLNLITSIIVVTLFIIARRQLTNRPGILERIRM